VYTELDKHALFRALVPYAFPHRTAPKDIKTSLRNNWVFLSLHLPIDIPDDKAVDRLRACKAELDSLKDSPEAVVGHALQVVAGTVLPYKAQLKTSFDVMSRHSLVFTNVPGPINQVYIGKYPIQVRSVI